MTPACWVATVAGGGAYQPQLPLSLALRGPSTLSESQQAGAKWFDFPVTFLQVSKVSPAAPPTPQSKEPWFNLRLDVC